MLYLPWIMMIADDYNVIIPLTSVQKQKCQYRRSKEKNGLLPHLLPETFPPLLVLLLYCPSSWSCRSSGSKKPSIRDSKVKRYGAYCSQGLAAISGTLEFYHRFRSNDFRDIRTILSFLEFGTSYLTVLWIVLMNFSWREKLQELRVMLYVFECLRRFGSSDEERGFYENLYYFCCAGILWSVFCGGTRFLSYVSEENGGVATLHYVYSFFAEYLVSSFYTRILMDTSVYLGFFRKIAVQVDRELKTKLQYRGNISLAPESCHFLKKMLALRRSYLAVLASFRRSRWLLSGFTEFSTVGGYLQLIWLLFVSIMSLGDIVVFDYKRRLTLLRILGRIGFVYLWAYTCDQIENSVTEMETLFFRVPSANLNREELRELEVFTKLINWEKPMKGPKTNISFGKSCFSGLMVDIVVNAMVLIQLYFWFGN